MLSEECFAEGMRAWADKLNELGAEVCRRPDSWLRLGAELDRLCEFILREDNERFQWRLESDRDAQEAAGSLRDASARALGALEKMRARQICAHGRSVDLYSSLLSASVREEREGLRLRRGDRVMFIGSGAFPASAFAIAETASEVLCVDIDEEAIRHGTELARYLGMKASFRFLRSHLDDTEFVSAATHVFIASLVPEKRDILRELRSYVRPDCRIVVRYGNGLKSLFNYPLDTGALTEWRAAAPGMIGRIYDTAILRSRTTAYEWQNSHFIASGT
ncbi:class I SAM-dependent methyltransferase [Cohnella sp.]|uniref:class I SAM-dependent methyltransferase n=1 Tax=Cohnella sp. TaxID=1883426 RepID=UPI0037040635